MAILLMIVLMMIVIKYKLFLINFIYYYVCDII